MLCVYFAVGVIIFCLLKVMIYEYMRYKLYTFVRVL